MDFEKNQKIESWKRLGKLVLAIIGFLIVLIFFISYSYEEDEREKLYNMDEDEKELLEEMSKEGN
jgi:hypothetical protein